MKLEDFTNLVSSSEFSGVCTTILDEKTEQLTVEISPDYLISFCNWLKSDKKMLFTLLLDICGVDYLEYGNSDWQTRDATASGFSRGVERQDDNFIPENNSKRFAVVYHLLSIEHNKRLRVRVFVSEETMMVPSVVNIWPSANWYEREAFDLYGILFAGHPDLRRILTDYGFIGHPFRKDFPLSGNVEVRFDESKGRVVYEPVSIEPRVLVPKTIIGQSAE